MSTIHLVRHGESEANLANSINDDPARLIKLTAAGRQQSTVRAKAFQHIPLTHAFSSEFPRTQETLRILLQAHPQVTPQVDPRLNEWQTGMDGKSLDYFHERMTLGVALPESFDDIVTRVKQFIDEARSLGEGSNILVVSHKITIVAGMVVLGKLGREDAKHATVNNCDVFSMPL